MRMHFDLVALNVTLNLAAYLSQIERRRLKADAVGASNVTSSAYARAPINSFPIQHPTFSFFNSRSRLSK
jgi:hypothetical protein